MELLALLTQALLLAFASAAPTPHPTDGPHLALRQWNSTDGLPQNSVNDIARLPDGRLVLGTSGGLAYFDGTTFEVEGQSTLTTFRSSRFRRVQYVPGWGLLAGTEDGRLLHAEAGVWRYLELVGDQTAWVNDVALGQAGDLWVATMSGLQHIPAGAERATRVTMERVDHVEVDAAGRVFTGRSEGQGLWVREDGVARLVCTGGIGALTQTPDGGLWGVRDGVLFSASAEGLLSEFPADFTVHSLGADPLQGLYLMGGSKLAYFDGSRVTWTLNRDELHLLAEDRLLSMQVMSDGRVWLGASVSGLLYLHPSPLGLIAPREARMSFIRAVLTTTEGDLIALGEQVYHLVEGALEPLPLKNVRLIASASEGGFWFTTFQHLMRWRQGAVEEVLEFNEQHAAPQQMLELANGALALVDGATLTLLDAGTLAKHQLPEPYGSPFVLSLFEDSAGQLWIAGQERVYRFDGRDFALYSAGRELPFGPVRSFVEHGGAIWAGTYGGGIVRIEGDTVQTIDARNGLRENVASVLVDLGDTLFVVHNSSVALYAWQDLEAVVAGTRAYAYGRVFDSGPGIDLFESNAQLTPRFARDAGGSIYFAALGGLAWFDPRTHIAQPEQVRPHVRSLLPENTLTELGADGVQMFVPPVGARDVRFEFCVPSFEFPTQQRFRYRLAGLEEDWNFAPTSIAVEYRDLDPGDYAFEVQAALFGGAFGPRNAAQPIAITPYWHERTLVRYCIGGLGVLLLLGLGIIRSRGVRARNRLMEQRVSERTRRLNDEVTERRRVEEELRQAGEQLEQKVQLRTIELARALTNLEWDIQRREKLEGRLRDAEKLEAVGRLAGGLAHDFNNILTAIMGEVDLTQLELDYHKLDDETSLMIRKHIDNVRDAGQRAASLTRQLLAYSRQQVMQPRVVSPLKVLLNLRTMLDRLVPEDVELHIDGNSTTASVRIDPSQLEQVIVNLVVNAAEAMPDGGRIDAYVLEESLAKGEDVVTIVVRDTGPGFSSEHRDHIFEPFYSTKGTARGLGLASVHGIVHQSKGTIAVESVVGQGATFRVTFPRSSEAESVDPIPVEIEQPGPLRILLVDDEDEVRRVSRKMLERAGHLVTDTGLPEEAVRILRESGNMFDVLITDVVMPRMNGKQLATHARLHCEHLQVLFISGYSTDVLSERDLTIDHSNLLPKPFDGRGLCRRVAELAVSRPAS